MTDLIVVVGGMYGSEAKGHVTAKVVRDEQPESSAAVVRVAGPNAGHTAYDSQGRSYAFRQVPVGVVVDRPGGITGFIAAGSELDVPVVVDELNLLKERGMKVDLWIDPEATLITERDKIVEAVAVDDADRGTLVERIGSTGKGIGAARAGRLMRQPGRRLQDDEGAIDALVNAGARVGQVAPMLRNGEFGLIVIEGTQGYALGLHAGHYPQCTSSDCRAIDFLAMTGIAPWEPWVAGFHVIVVARVFPIRVAGNSGPMRDETTWEALGLPEERTTVTKKVRRVGGEDWPLVAAAVEANGGAAHVSVALTMVDQKFPQLFGVDEFSVMTQDTEFAEWYNEVSIAIGAPVVLVTTGPDTGAWAMEGIER